ncbi:MAG: Ig-like domain-containing protein [Agathobacter sp.]|nr:Ig-like domain-containing protein [Lachnobacterium sp.]MDY2912493.1 Ig-like domain-containing protein [Agathobacter sp.]
MILQTDTSSVDTSKVGEYEVTASYKKETYTITVKVEDTTAPEFELAQDSIVTNDLESLDADNLVESVKDASDTTTEIKFDTESKEDGEYDASVVVTDEYGNSAEKAITVVLDTTAPTISGVEDATVETEPTAEKEESDNRTYYYEVPVI